MPIRPDENETYKRLEALESELEDMTAALTLAWDQLAPFLQDEPSHTGVAQTFEPIMHALMAAADTEAGGIYLFEDDEWHGFPGGILLSSDLQQQLKALTNYGETLICQNNCAENNADLHWVFAPVITENVHVGAIGIGSRERERAFTAADKRILVRMAERAAGQLVSAQLAKSREREAAAQHDLEIASMVQRSTQPLAPPQTSQIDLASFWEPARQVGGDAWGWVLQPDGTFTWFILDIAGKGLPAALAAMSLHTAIRLGLSLGLKPGALLTMINQEFYDTYTQTDLLATAAILAFNPATGIYEQASAGHPPIFIRKGHVWGTLEANVPPIGVLPTIRLETQFLKLETGDLIACYSDGFTEIETPEGWWGEAGLMQAISEGGESVHEITRHVVKGARQANGANEIRDDQTLVVVAIN